MEDEIEPTSGTNKWNKQESECLLLNHSVCNDSTEIVRPDDKCSAENVREYHDVLVSGDWFLG